MINPRDETAASYFVADFVSPNLIGVACPLPFYDIQLIIIMLILFSKGGQSIVVEMLCNNTFSIQIVWFSLTVFFNEINKLIF